MNMINIYCFVDFHFSSHAVLAVIQMLALYFHLFVILILLLVLFICDSYIG